MRATKALTSSRRGRGKKGSLEETLSYALYKDRCELFTVLYRDKDKIKRAPLKEFLESEEMGEIPLTRIVAIARNEVTVWKKGQKEVHVKKF